MFRRQAVESREDEVLCARRQLTMRSERVGHVHVIELIGELDMESAPAFDSELKRVERGDAAKIVVDLGGLKFISSDGLKALIHAESRSRNRRYRLRLLRGSDQVQNTFETAGLISRLPFDDDPEPGWRAQRTPRARVVVSRPDGTGAGSVP
jgi:anti-sigma B factor antagonist